MVGFWLSLGGSCKANLSNIIISMQSCTGHVLTNILIESPFMRLTQH